MSFGRRMPSDKNILLRISKRFYGNGALTLFKEIKARKIAKQLIPTIITSLDSAVARNKISSYGYDNVADQAICISRRFVIYGRYDNPLY
jgi:hypothetical protein